MTPRWVAESFDGDVLAARVGYEGDDVVADWPGKGRLRATRDGRSASFVPAAGASPREIEKLVRGPVRLLVHHLSGGLSLHGAAVAIGGHACVLIGASGQGKSTLAAALCERLGARLLGDDAVAIRCTPDRDEVLALEHECWLTPEAAALFGHATIADDKEPFAVPAPDSALAQPSSPYDLPLDGVPLAAIVHLDFIEGARPRLRRTFGLDAVAGVIPQVTRFILDDPEVARRDLGTLGAIVDRTPVYRLERPLRLEDLDEAARLVANATAKEGP